MAEQLPGKIATPPKTVPTTVVREGELIFASETDVRKHYGPMIQAAGQELSTKVRGTLASVQQSAKGKSTALTFGLAGAGIVVAGLTISTIITGVVGLALIATVGAVTMFVKYRFPVWIAKMRSQQVVDLANVAHQKQIALEAEEERYINALRQRAANDPIATRTRIANEVAKEIDDAEEESAKFEGLLNTQAKNIADAKQKFPKQSFAEEEAVQSEMGKALEVMNADRLRARGKLDEYIQATKLIETRLKLAAGARSMAEFMQDDSAKDRIREMVSSVATESAETEFQEARAALRSSAAAAKRRLESQ